LVGSGKVAHQKHFNLLDDCVLKVVPEIKSGTNKKTDLKD
jgi:hypothetical protein